MRTGAQISVSRGGDLLSARPGAWQGTQKDLASPSFMEAARAFGPALTAASPSGCSLFDVRFIRAVPGSGCPFRRRARHLLRQIVECRAGAPSLAGVGAACNADAPQKGAGQRASFRAHLFPNERAPEARACTKLASSDGLCSRFSWRSGLRFSWE